MRPGAWVIALALLALAAGVMAAIPQLPTRGRGGLDLPFLDAGMPPVVAAFAGFPGCASICPPSLQALGRAYDQLDGPERDRAALLFINLQAGTAPQASALYAQAFHPAFMSFDVDSQTAAALHRHLALPSYESASRAADHSGKVYLFSRGDDGWRIAQVYQGFPASPRLARRLKALTARPTGLED